MLSRGQSLADTLWDREWEAGDWTTPERRAKLEGQLRKLVLSIADPAVRSHYGRIIAEKLSEAWRPSSHQRSDFKPGNQPHGSRPRSSGGARGGPWRGTGKPGSRYGGFGAIAPSHSASLKKSSFVAPGTASHKYREALLLRTLANHPWLIEEVVEELAALDFQTTAFGLLRDALLNACADEKNLDTLSLRNHLESSGFAPNLEQTERMATNKCHAFAEPDADRVTVENGWRHTLSLHQQQSLRDQLTEAEREYRQNLDEDALARILELQRLIATIVPKEAVFE